MGGGLVDIHFEYAVRIGIVKVVRDVLDESAAGLGREAVRSAVSPLVGIVEVISADFEDKQRHGLHFDVLDVDREDIVESVGSSSEIESGYAYLMERVGLDLGR